MGVRSFKPGGFNAIQYTPSSFARIFENLSLVLILCSSVRFQFTIVPPRKCFACGACLGVSEPKLGPYFMQQRAGPCQTEKLYKKKF